MPSKSDSGRRASRNGKDVSKNKPVAKAVTPKKPESTEAKAADAA
jgi:hypothetical protein